MNRFAALISIYAAIGLLFGGLATYLRGSPWTHPDPWMDLTPTTAHMYSGLLGLTLGLGAVACTSVLVRRTAFARALHEELRPLATGLPAGGIVALALFSSLGEEMLFRSVLQSSTNIWIQALVFGLAHQLPGRARLTWAVWATIMGLLFGALFQATGSLLGPLVAHATINAMNLRFLQNHRSSKPPARNLGGILGQRT
jgi:membrane protease YdiL (CAAX protease family)